MTSLAAIRPVAAAGPGASVPRWRNGLGRQRAAGLPATTRGTTLCLLCPHARARPGRAAQPGFVPDTIDPK